ncbi:MAG: hypothetical protein J7604_02590 [Sporocytophaga sp.]|uniref:hypothetical protein n=1 Tax=Sporocytophaga sp. TaxID=2231183 RepID=UPI001B013844|nr:hypothetical protein [Sporocytophaga sp.]MBO9699066.1 hypothetical protein [Sporocytophaga sp.]
MKITLLRNNSLVFFFCMVMLLSCTSYSIEEYVNHVNENEVYVKKQEAGDFTLTCQFRPAEYLACAELRQMKKYNRQQFESVKMAFENALYFSLRISRNDSANVLLHNVANQQEYGLRLNYLSNFMGEHFYLITSSGAKVIPMVYEYQRSYGNSPDACFIFSFPSSAVENERESIQLVYDDKLFDIPEEVRWNFSIRDITGKQPKIKFPS